MFFAGIRFVSNLIQDDALVSNEPTPLPANSIGIFVASSNTKKTWLDNAVAQFNSESHKVSNGKTVFVEVEHVTSGGSMNAILDGEIEPIAWSPGDGSWVAQANTIWQGRNRKPIASQTCQATIYAPLGFAMWRPMAETLGWPNTPIGWDTIVDEDTVGQPSQGQMFATCLPNSAESDGVKIFPIAFGGDADTDTLSRIAAVTGGRMFKADPESIKKVYESISAEQ